MTRFARLLSAATCTLLLLGCEGAVDPSTAPPAAASVAQPASLLGLASGGLAVCPTARYDSVSALIGPGGGKLSVGPHQFVVPAGALSAPVRITMVRPADNTASARFYPEGLQFTGRVLPQLTLSFSSCRRTGLLPPSIVYVTEQGGLIENLLTLVLNLLGSTVTAKISHFSRYAVAW